MKSESGFSLAMGSQPFPGEPGTIFSDLKHLLNLIGFKRYTYFGNTIIYKVEEEDGKILKISENA